MLNIRGKYSHEFDDLKGNQTFSVNMIIIHFFPCDGYVKNALTLLLNRKRANVTVTLIEFIYFKLSWA